MRNRRKEISGIQNAAHARDTKREKSSDLGFVICLIESNTADAGNKYPPGVNSSSLFYMPRKIQLF
jgi:hypothetical protein